MAYQVTQRCLQALIASESAARSERTAMLALIENYSGAYASHVCLSILYDPTPPVPADADMVTMEMLVAEDGNFFAGTTWSDILLENDSNMYATQTWAEALIDYEQISPNAPTYDPMSDYLFPELPGIEWDCTKTPKFSTQISPHVSGREVRMSNYAYPIWTFEMSYEFLRAGAEQELQTLMGFFLQRGGAFDTFLYDDPDEDNEVRGLTIGQGDDLQTKWTLYKTFAGFTEPCGYVDPSSVKVYFTGDGWTLEQTTGWTIISPNQIVFDVPVPLGISVSVDYDWYYRVRFGDDSLTFSQFMFQLWELKKVTLQTVKP